MTPDAGADPRASRSRVLHAKVVVGLGNPGPRYDGTRHNVGWWVLDRFAHDRDFESFERSGRRLESSGEVAGRAILLVKPRTYMNRSGLALTSLREMDGFEVARDLLVVTDDANLDVGRVRFRPGGGTGGHKGLGSVTGTLGTRDFARLRIGVGVAPAGVALSDWVLAEMPPEDEDAVVALLPELADAVAVWADEGVEAAMNRFNR